MKEHWEGVAREAGGKSGSVGLHSCFRGQSWQMLMRDQIR